MNPNELSRVQRAKNVFELSLTLATVSLAVFAIIVTSSYAQAPRTARILIGCSGMIFLIQAVVSFFELTDALGIAVVVIVAGASFYSLLLAGMALLLVGYGSLILAQPFP